MTGGSATLGLSHCEKLFFCSFPTHTSPILDNTLLMKVALVCTFPALACFATVDKGFGLETSLNTDEGKR